MERIPKGDKRLFHRRNLNSSLFFHVVIPYIKMKLDRLYHNLKENYSESSSTFRNASLRQKMVQTYLLTYPYIHMFWEGSQVTFYLLYAVGKSPYHSILMWLQSVQLHHLSSERFKEMELSEIRKSQRLGSSDSLKDKAHYIGNKLASNFVVSLTTTFEVGAFFIQFLDWW